MCIFKEAIINGSSDFHHFFSVVALLIINFEQDFLLFFIHFGLATITACMCIMWGDQLNNHFGSDSNIFIDVLFGCVFGRSEA